LSWSWEKFLLRPLSSLIRQREPSHWRLTQRGTSDPPVLRLRQGRLPERAESAAGDRRRTPAPHSVSDVVRTGRRQRAARERHQAARGPRAVATTLRQHGAIVSAETLERPHPASSPVWHPVLKVCCSDAPCFEERPCLHLAFLTSREATVLRACLIRASNASQPHRRREGLGVSEPRSVSLEQQHWTQPARPDGSLTYDRYRGR